MSRRIGLIGAPSGAGAHWPGKGYAPRALRDAEITTVVAATTASGGGEASDPARSSAACGGGFWPGLLACVGFAASALAVVL